MLKFLLLTAAATAAALLFTGCASINDKDELTSYTPPAAMLPPGGELTASIYMPMMKDGRAKLDVIPYNLNADPLILIPLWPYSRKRIAPIDKYNYMEGEFITTLQGLFYEDMAVSGLAGEVVSANPLAAAAAPVKADYELRLTLQKAEWDRSLTAYGLSIAGMQALWLFLPVSYGEVIFGVKAELLAGGEIIAGKTITRKSGCTEWIYEQVGYSPRASELELTRMFPDIASELRMFVLETMRERKK